MAFLQKKRAIGTFPSRQQAEEALHELRNSGFSMDKVSVLAKDTDRNDQIAGADVKDRGDTEAQEGAGIGATTGTVLGGIGGLLVGLEALLIPGAGPFLAAGTIATTLAGAGIGAAAGGIVGALTGLGIPEEEAKGYSDRVSQGHYLVTIEGYEEEVERAASILSNRGILGWRVYDISDNPSSSSDVSRAGMHADTERYVDRNTTDGNTVEIIDKRDRVR
ncbi:general stress protein [Nostocaceae cyanobacterium CENA357]|uniref:General stress protein n=1 Tax=Atlanticothrix silvestris CENA357 TaxID=1725252 RepID=A0A8J7HN60_9CYAN|nr:general stress protein [Atlanticothrix silvestris]MBH8556041.1 general stress protein [Atlanticothrix silvestris CENA357]